jgi:hypothetical protein
VKRCRENSPPCLSSGNPFLVKLEKRTSRGINDARKPDLNNDGQAELDLT